MSGTNDNTDHYQGVLLEDIDNKLAAILEGQTSMANVPSKLENLDNRLTIIEGDVGVIKAVVTEQGKDIKGLKTELTAQSKDIGTLKTDVGSLKTEVVAQSKDIGTLKTESTARGKDISSLRKESNAHGKDLKSLKSELANQNKTINRLERKVDNGFAGIGDTIDKFIEHIDDRLDSDNHRLDDHDIRLIRLEKRVMAPQS